MPGAPMARPRYTTIACRVASTGRSSKSSSFAGSIRAPGTMRAKRSWNCLSCIKGPHFEKQSHRFSSLELEERTFDRADALEVDHGGRGEGMRSFEGGAGPGADMDAARLAIGFEPRGEIDGVAP